MQIIICKTKEEACRKAADTIASAIRANPRIVLGLATGSTPVAMYDELVKDNKAGKVDFSTVRSFNLDEYQGLPPEHDQSYRYFMNANLFDRVNIDKANTRVPPGQAEDVAAACAQYEADIKAAGGIDIQVLGIGSDGHIAFNEPGSSLVSRTRLVALTEQTIKDNARFFASEADVPRRAVSMGVGTIMEARKIVMLAFGANKAAAVKAAVEGGISQFCPASALQMHPDAMVFLDEEAASQLALKDFYKRQSANV